MVIKMVNGHAPHGFVLPDHEDSVREDAHGVAETPRRALERGEYVLHYQPKFTVADRRLPRLRGG